MAGGGGGQRLGAGGTAVGNDAGGMVGVAQHAVIRRPLHHLLTDASADYSHGTRKRAKKNNNKRAGQPKRLRWVWRWVSLRCGQPNH